MLTPEESIRIQNAIGADIIMQLDDVIATNITGSRVEESTFRLVCIFHILKINLYLCYVVTKLKNSHRKLFPLFCKMTVINNCKTTRQRIKC